MKKFLFVAGVALTQTQCATLGQLFPAKVVRVTGQQRILEYRTGNRGESFYDENFKAAAEKSCSSDKYEVIEKSHKPEVLKCAEELLDPEKYYWVVKCQ